MLTLESLKKYHEQLDAQIAYFDSIPVDELHVTISTGNMKVNTPNVSLPSDKTCPHCKDCQLACYDKKACLQYPNVMRARAKNYSILKRDPAKYFREIEEFIRGLKRDGFRFHVGGEISSYDYLDNMVILTNNVKRDLNWTYTKSQDIVNEYIKNHGGNWKEIAPFLTIMYSRWGYAPIDNPYGMPVFWTIVKGQPKPEGMYHCPGKCKICMENHRGCPYGESAWIEEH